MALEQDAPACVLLSDPSLPDRTEVILSRRPETAAVLAAVLAARWRMRWPSCGRRLYQLKASAPAEPLLRWLDELGPLYGVDGFIFGCTELHLLQPALAARAAQGAKQVMPAERTERGAGAAWPAVIVDPLDVAAKRLPELLAAA